MFRIVFWALTGVAPAALAVMDTAPAQENARPLVELRNRASLTPRMPLLIAHRGGVVGPEAPECSPAAIRGAAAAGYDLVELDVQESADRIPMVFHDRDLAEACGEEGAVSHYTAAELQAMRFLDNDEAIQTLDAALALCKSLGLGVMIDCKRGESQDFFDAIREAVDRHGLGNATLCINGDARIRIALKKAALLTLSDAEWFSLLNDGRPPLSERFWFGLPRDLPQEKLAFLLDHGVLIIPAINTFRYSPENHEREAAADVERLRAAGVHGFQIDSVYQGLFGRTASPAAGNGSSVKGSRP